MKKRDLLQGGEEPKKKLNVVLARRACVLEGCSAETSSCFGGEGVGLCVEAIAKYNELRKMELRKERSTTLDEYDNTPLARWFQEGNRIVGVL